MALYHEITKTSTHYTYQVAKSIEELKTNPILVRRINRSHPEAQAIKLRWQDHAERAPRNCN